MTKTLSWAAAPTARPLSATLLYFVAATLVAASDILTRLAARLSVTEANLVPVHTVEFHAVYRDAGAPEGALYINGELVGYIDGVRRL
ncbi:MAG: hypothetical protein ABIU58_05420 [Ramlibacter sp.]